MVLGFGAQGFQGFGRVLKAQGVKFKSFGAIWSTIV